MFACYANRPPATVKQVNLARYMGRWYEIASFPNKFQRGCRCSTADYRLQGKKMLVVNRCYKGEPPRLSEARAKAWPLAASGNSKLKVQFFWPFKANYWILYISPGYQQAIVGTPDRKYLWFLARKPVITASDYRKLRLIAQRKGFAINKLVKTQQNCVIQPLS